MLRDDHPSPSENQFAVRRICPDKFLRTDRGDQVDNLESMVRDGVLGVVGYTEATNVQVSLDADEKPFVCLFEFLDGGQRTWCHVSARFLSSFIKK